MKSSPLFPRVPPSTRARRRYVVNRLIKDGLVFIRRGDEQAGKRCFQAAYLVAIGRLNPAITDDYLNGIGSARRVRHGENAETHPPLAAVARERE